jgi:hypothetical protein
VGLYFVSEPPVLSDTGYAEFACGLAFVISGLTYVALHRIKNLLCFQLPSFLFFLLFLFSPPGPVGGRGAIRPASPHHYQTNGERLLRVESKFECVSYYGLFRASFSRRPESISQAWGIYGGDNSSRKITDVVESELLEAGEANDK